MNKIKILYIVSTLKNTGPINVLYGIIKNLDKNLFDVSIVTLSPESIDSREKDFLELGAIIKKVDKSRSSMIISGKKILFKFIKEINPDIIHSHGFRSDYYNSKYNRGVSFTTIHNYPHKDYIMEYGKFLGKLMYRSQIKYIKNIKYPVACSKAISNELEDIFGVRTLYIQNGIDVEKYENILNENEKIELKEKLNIPTNKKIIISVGKLNDRKNPIYLIESFLKSNVKNDYYLILLGDGLLMDDLKKRFGSEVMLLGNVNNVQEYLKISDLFVSASKAEGLPNAVLEAMANGIPTLLSNIPPHKEILEYNNNAGLIFELKNNDLVNKFNNISNYDISYMGMESKKIVEKFFASASMGRKYSELYISSVK